MRKVRENGLRAMERLPVGGRGAEVGTHDGRHTAQLVRIAQPSDLTLIDPWSEDEARDARSLAFTAPQSDRDADLARVRISHPEARILRQTSATALAGMEDGALDWLWLDGQKHYDVILRDLEAGARVVRPGGVIAGGGWHWGGELGRPVREAVGDLVARLPGARLEQKGQYWSVTLPETVQLAGRPADQRFLVVSTMKNESPYVLEWIAHNRALGFTDFLVYTNDCEDTTDPILDRLEEMGLVRHVVNTVLARGPHKSALKWAKEHVVYHKAHWILIADVDEFINVRSADRTIQGLLAELGPETDAVSFPWKIFGNGGIEDFADAPITRQFTACEPPPRNEGRAKRDVKTMFRRPEAMYHIGLHRPRVAPEWQNRIVWKSPSGEDISERMNPSKTWSIPWKGCDRTAYMHHYPLRSMEAYILKKNRGRANHINEDLGLEYWDKWNMNEGHDDTLVDGLPGFQAELARLMGDRKLRDLHAQGIEWHRDQFRTLMAEPRYRELWEGLKRRQGHRATEAQDG